MGGYNKKIGGVLINPKNMTPEKIKKLDVLLWDKLAVQMIELPRAA